MPQTAGSFDLTVSLNIKYDGGISSTSDGTVGSTPNGMHVRRGLDKHTGVSPIYRHPYQHHLTQCQMPHTSRLCQRHLSTCYLVQSITENYSSGISVHNTIILQITGI